MFCPVHFSQAAEQIKLLYKLFLKVDATQVEINPFGETPDGKGIRTHCWRFAFQTLLKDLRRIFPFKLIALHNCAELYSTLARQ